MKRSDLAVVLTTEGGLSTRLQQTFVSRECPYIKVDVVFKAADDNSDAAKEDQDDLIQTISKPYLDWSVMD